MTKKPQTSKDAADKVAKNIRGKTRQTYSTEEKIRIVLAGLRGEESISVLCPSGGTACSTLLTSAQTIYAGLFGAPVHGLNLLGSVAMRLRKIFCEAGDAQPSFIACLIVLIRAATSPSQVRYATCAQLSQTLPKCSKTLILCCNHMKICNR